MSESAAGRESVWNLSDQDILRTFDSLVEGWEMSEDARYALEAFQRENPEPQPQENPFEAVGELINYN